MSQMGQKRPFFTMRRPLPVFPDKKTFSQAEGMSQTCYFGSGTGIIQSLRRRETTGDMIIVRYADDFIVGFEQEHDARRFLDALRERLKEFALSLHPEKTRLIEFGRFAAENRKRRGLGKPETRAPCPGFD